MDDDWQLLPAKPTPEMLAAFLGYVPKDDSWVAGYKAMLAAAPLPPNETLTQEEARSAQHWKGMDGACAWHLIFRHAEGWGETATMMQAWLDANREPPNA